MANDTHQYDNYPRSFGAGDTGIKALRVSGYLIQNILSSLLILGTDNRAKTSHKLNVL